MVSIQDDLWRCALYFFARDGLLNARRYKFQKRKWMEDAGMFQKLAVYLNKKKQKTQKKTPRQLSLFDFTIYASNLPGVKASQHDFESYVTAAVLFVDVLKKEQLERLRVLLKPISLMRRLFICSNNVTAASLVTLKKKYLVEVFDPVCCLLRPEKHVGQPIMRLAVRKEVDQLIGEQEESSLELCKISQQDPQVKFNGWATGTIVQIMRPTQDGLQPEYRIVAGAGD